MTRALAPRLLSVLLLALLASCGGGGGGSNSGPSTSGNPVPPPPPAVPGPGKRVEESDAAVTLTGTWTKSDSALGWSGGSAMQTTAAGATATIKFNGTSIRWLGSRGRGMGMATVSVDGVVVRQADLFARPADEAHTPVVTIYDLAPGDHTLTITATGTHNPQGEGNAIVVDAFDVQPSFTVSHWQDTNPDLQYTGNWTKSSENFPWSGNGVSNLPERPVTAHETQAAGDKMTVPFRGTGIEWVGYRGPDAGIAQVQVDGGAATTVDLYAANATYQPTVFSASGLADANHTLTITSTGTKNAASSGTRVVVDALDVLTPGRRYEEYDKSITYSGTWTTDNDARVWSEGVTDTSNQPGATASFTFTGTSVSWIGCEKGSAGATKEAAKDSGDRCLPGLARGCARRPARGP